MEIDRGLLYTAVGDHRRFLQLYKRALE
jgi:hypothetical protein